MTMYQYDNDHTGAISLNVTTRQLAHSSSMRVVLLAESGNMCTAWLPAEKEGRHRFVDSSGLFKYPFYIEADQNVWVLNVGQEGVFANESPNRYQMQPQHELQLSSKMIARFISRGETFVVYAEDVTPGDNVFLPYYFEERTDYTIGRLDKNHICYPNNTVSRTHAVLHWNGNQWEIHDRGSANGVYVNGRRVNSCVLSVGDTVFIMGLYMIMGAGFFAINNANNRVQFYTPKIRHIERRGDISFAEPKPASITECLYDRMPRKMTKIEPEPIEFENPPSSLNGGKIPLLLRMGNPLLMGGQALVTGNVFMALSGMLLPSLTQGMTEKERKEYEAKRQEKYHQYLDYKRAEINNEKITEEQLLNSNYPGLLAAMQFPISKQRLWERRKTDDDFLSVRVGYGSIPLIAEKKYAKRRFEIEPDELNEEMYKLAEQEVWLDNAPVMLSLIDDWDIGVSGDKRDTIAFLRNLIFQLALTHSYDEMKVVLLADPADALPFEFVRYLPHNWDNEKTIRFFATSQSDASLIAKHLNQELENSNDNSRGFNLKNSTSYVVIALSKNLFTCMETLHTVIEKDNYCGITILTCFEGLPKECSKIVNLHNRYRLIDYIHPDVEDQFFQLDAYSPQAADVSLKHLMVTKLLMDSSGFSLPNAVTFLEMYGAGKVEHLNPIKRWEESNPIKSLAAPIGIGTDGQLFTLDLHEKRQGPHGLIAGMTGSGKSEFIITYILSMAVNYSPDEVAFVLIDYKGGGLADAFENKEKGIHLPHVVGTITNLDGAAIQRSLASINSELMRRQEIFKRAKTETNEGTMDIYDYQKLYRSGRVSEPLPHLLIISDEFAELKAQQPEFMNELISAARIGRSLGVHLVLATQKPGGVVNDQILSNTKFRVCLRVQDRTDSMEMLKRPDAAELKTTGRYYLQVGYNEYFAQGQSAWCGAEYVPQEEALVEEDKSVDFLDNVGQTILNVKPPVERTRSGVKQIVAIVQYLSDLAKREGIRARQLWLEPLPSKLELDEVVAREMKYSDGLYATIGMVDDPVRQSQFPLQLDMLNFNNMLICGNSGSGKSTLIKTLLLRLVESYSPEKINYYILDLSAGALTAFKDMPHCGAYLTDQNEQDVGRLLDLMKEIVEERKKLFLEAEVTNYDAYLAINQLPLILMIIDGYSNIKNIAHGNDYFNQMHEYLRDASNYGIRYILSSNHVNEVSSKSKQELDYRLALKAKDRYDYTDILETKCTTTPPDINGRGMCVVDGRPLEYHVAIPNCEASDQDGVALLKERLRVAAYEYPSATVSKKLLMIDANQEYSEFCGYFEKERLPLGYLTQDMRRIALPFQQMYELSFYFGNPVGIKPVLENLVTACRHNDMDLVVMRRKSDTFFDAGFENQIRETLAGRFELLDTSAEGISALNDMIFNEIKERNTFRDEYCERYGIPSSDSGRAKKAAKYIRANTRPMLVMFESFGDVCRQEKDENATAELTAFISRTRGYNIYFAGCFYPNEEGNIANNPLMKSFNPDELLLLFGGQYDKQCLTMLPMDLRGIEQINPKYDRFVLKYQGKYNTLLMPCGELNSAIADPDEAAII